MSSERRVVWAHGLRKLRIQKAFERDRKAVATITEALRDPDAVDMVGEFCYANSSWGALGDGKLLDMLDKIGDWFLEHSDEILALLMKLIAMKRAEDDALASLAAAPGQECQVAAPGTAGIGVLAGLLALFGLLWSSPACHGQQIVEYASIAPGESVFELVSPVGEPMCVGPNCRRAPLASMLDFVAPRATVGTSIRADEGLGSVGSSFSASPRPMYQFRQQSYGSSGSASGRLRPVRRLWR